jgi:hypothetical protein
MTNKLNALRCVEVTSQTQANNGTICYYDPIAKCDYLSYISGYIRRSYKTKSWRGDRTIETIYQLNPQKKVKKISSYSGNEFTVTERVRIYDDEERMDLLARAVVNYRETVKSYNR